MSELKSELLFEMIADLEEPQPIGATPHGVRMIYYVTGGTFKGPEISGKVLPGGGDWILMRPDGAGELDVRATLCTDDNELIYVRYRGILEISPEIMEQIQSGTEVDPSEYYFRTAPVFETASEKYGWLNRIISVGVGTALTNRVSYKVYRIL